jgi:hypothetical protein
MKRSKIFLGATTALLAVVGAVGAKAHKAYNLTVFYTNSFIFCEREYAAVTTMGNDSRTFVGYTNYNCIGGKHVYTPEN